MLKLRENMISSNYSYPLDPSWNTEDITKVLRFLNQVEHAYENSVKVDDLLDSYKEFKKFVKSKAQEKQIDREFQRTSGYSTYQAVKAAQQQAKGFISLGR
ncbi:Unknown [Streptococcus agalactiae COH1]|nr:Unknown [Streptococcus agalactiae COH1]